MSSRTVYRILSTEEIRRREFEKKPIKFRILLIGETGIGKSTFLNNLCNKKIFPISPIVDLNECSSDKSPNARINIVTKRVQIDGNYAAPIDLEVVLFSECGDHVNNSRTPEQIGLYLESQLAAILSEETKIKRNLTYRDSRAHVCLYFLRPDSNGLREFDKELMKHLGNKLNVIPILAKADILTEEELNINKQLIREDIEANNITIFDFEEDKLDNSLMEVSDCCNTQTSVTSSLYIRDMVPFSVICCDQEIITNDGQIRHIRECRCGHIVVEDPESSDFTYLKSILLGSHLQKLKHITIDTIYEKFRTETLLNQQKTNNHAVKVRATHVERPNYISYSKRRNAFSMSTESSRFRINELPFRELNWRSSIMEESKSDAAFMDKKDEGRCFFRKDISK